MSGGIRMYSLMLAERGRQHKRIIGAEFRERVEDMAREARRLTSGGISSRELRRRGHPFGWGAGRYTYTSARTGNQFARRRGSRMSTPMLPINRQTRRLYDAWNVARRRGGRVTVYELQNATPYARFVLAAGGTSLMRPRGFVQALSRYGERRRRAMYTRIAAAIRAKGKRT